MNVFLSYLNQRKGIIGLFFLFAAICLAVFALYQLPLAAVLYPLGLCGALGLLFLLLDYRKTARRHRCLQAIRGSSDVLSQPLPSDNGVLAGDYRQIIRLLCQEQQRRTTEQNRSYQAMVDYYTVWVHQFKTPIASMHLHLQQEDTPLARQLSLDLMHIEQYVEMVLTFLRLDAASTDYVIQEYDLDVIVRRTVRKFAGEFIARKLKLDYAPLNTRVITDEKWLSFVIEQVLSNALKYTPSGSITIYLTEPKTLCIRDTGIGIWPEDLPRIFDQGYTGYHGRSHQKASGIGLYLCRRICRNLGHSIQVQSAPDQGTTVCIHLEQTKLEPE